MNIYTAAKLNPSDIDRLRASLHEIFDDSTSFEDAIHRCMEKYDQESFIIGALVGMEFVVVCEETETELPMGDPNNN